MSTVTGVVQRKAALKEKIVQMYDSLLRGETTHAHYEPFWAEFFLLKPKVGVLEAEVAKMATEALFSGPIKANINALFEKCVENLSEERQPIKIVYSLQTLCGLLRSVLKKRPNNEDVVNLLMGYEAADVRMLKLVGHLSDFLMSGHDLGPASLKDLCLKCLIIMATGFDNVSSNALLEFLMTNSVFEALAHLLSTAELRSAHGHSAVLVLAILVQYR